MSCEKFSTARKELLRLRSELEAGAPSTIGGAPQGASTVMDIAERAAESQDFQTTTALHNVKRIELEAIDQALRRIDAGRYGICTLCGEDIDPRRLKAAPQAVHCKACAERMDRTVHH